MTYPDEHTEQKLAAISELIKTRPVRLTHADEKLLAAAYAAGMTVAYGYIGGMGHFNPTVVCIELTKILDERVMVTEEIKIVCDQNGEWEFI
jgi:hypothetical protein